MGWALRNNRGDNCKSPLQSSHATSNKKQHSIPARALSNEPPAHSQDGAGSQQLFHPWHVTLNPSATVPAARPFCLCCQPLRLAAPAAFDPASSASPFSPLIRAARRPAACETALVFRPRASRAYNSLSAPPLACATCTHYSSSAPCQGKKCTRFSLCCTPSIAPPTHAVAPRCPPFTWTSAKAPMSRSEARAI
jgi:hypothetical protein